jgi:FlaA1/EpsC-like NDP-sugar epimerase
MFYSSQSGGNKTTKFITTRLGSVLDPNALLFSCLTGKLPMAVQSRLLPESVRYFMNTKEACQLILEAAAMGDGGRSSYSIWVSLLKLLILEI